MPQYKRFTISGGTYFFTQVTYQRYPWLCQDTARIALRTAINKVRQNNPFLINAFILLPDHLHCIWTLPNGDSDFSTRWRLIKTFVTKNIAQDLALDIPIQNSHQKRRESNLWQRRFWEHLICNEDDYIAHCNYIHYNPVKHGLCQTPKEWPFSSFHRFVQQDIYADDWGVNEIGDIPTSITEENFD